MCMSPSFLQTISTLSGHSKKVTGVILHPQLDAVVSSSLDGTVRLWSNQGTLETVRVYMSLSDVSPSSLYLVVGGVTARSNVALI